MNTRLTINNLYARVAMLLLVTVISIETRAAYDFGEVTINGIESMLLKDQTTTIKYSLTYYNENDCPDGPLTLGEDDYDVEVVYEEGNDEKVFCVENIYGNLTITLTQIYKPKTCKLVFSPKSGGSYEGGSKKIDLSVVRFEGSSPFVVVNRDEGLTLKLLAECVNAGISFKGESFKLGTDLDYENIVNKYIPIGGNYNSEDRFFEGTFDGDGHTIKGVNIDSSSGDIGLFGGISKGAEIKNLTLDHASITGSDITGGIVGCNTGGIITNCHVTSSVTIKANKDSSGERFGGIVGNNGFYEKDGTKGKVSNCSSAATLQGANRLVGGIAGNNEPGCTLSNNVVAGASITGLNDTGGIVGCNTGGTITNCHVTSSVTIKAKDGNGERFGGIVGNNSFYEKVGTETVYGTVSNCSSGATLQSANKYVGGIAGSNKSGCTLSNNVVVRASIPTLTNKTYGTITGSNGSNDNLANNYYADCTVGSNIARSDVGIGGKEGQGDQEDQEPYDVSGKAEPAIALYDTEDNSATIEAAIEAEKTHNVILAGRTLYKDGKWNTLCLPFNATKTGPLADATIKELDLTGSYSYTDGNHVTGFDSKTGTLYLNFKDATADNDNIIIKAGTPYIIKWANGDNLVAPAFSSVDITNTGLVDNIVSNDGYLKFKGTYSPKNIYTADKTFLYLGSDNKLYYPSGENMTSFNVNACRAYFELLNGLTAGDPISGVRSFRLNFDGDPTGITTTNYTNFTNSENTWYDLQGRRIANGKLSNGKLPKGLYIHNGRKVVIK